MLSMLDILYYLFNSFVSSFKGDRLFSLVGDCIEPSRISVLEAFDSLDSSLIDLSSDFYGVFISTLTAEFLIIESFGLWLLLFRDPICDL